MPGLGGSVPGGVPGRGVLLRGVPGPGGPGRCPPGGIATAADGTHPTGMHSCRDMFNLILDSIMFPTYKSTWVLRPGPCDCLFYPSKHSLQIFLNIISECTMFTFEFLEKNIPTCKSKRQKK